MNLSKITQYKKNKNNHFIYYLKNFLSYSLPDFLYQSYLSTELKKISNYDENDIMNRVNYYNKLENITNLCENKVLLKDFQLKEINKFRPTTHFFDTYKYSRYFSKDNFISLLFGDNISIPVCPSIVKSRPILKNNENAILLKLNALRHFMFVNDKKKIDSKKDMLVGRCAIYQPQRIKFWEIYFGHPMCNLGQTSLNPIFNEKWMTPNMSIAEHLNYKFILCLEGNDVATNLKWVMSSNSLAVMPKPKYETWLMEGKLIPDFHYIEIKDDYSDLIEKLNYYIKNTAEAIKISENANKFIRQFQDKQKEKLISLLVLKKYFDFVK